MPAAFAATYMKTTACCVQCSIEYIWILKSVCRIFHEKQINNTPSYQWTILVHCRQHVASAFSVKLLILSPQAYRLNRDVDHLTLKVCFSR